MAGREIFKKRKQLRAFNNFVGDTPQFIGYKTTDVQITSELASQARVSAGSTLSPSNMPVVKPDSNNNHGYEPYTVNIASVPLSPWPRISHGTSAASVHTTRHNRTAMEANTAAWGYTKVALLFFISLLVTWVSTFLFSTSWTPLPPPSEISSPHQTPLPAFSPILKINHARL